MPPPHTESGQKYPILNRVKEPISKEIGGIVVKRCAAELRELCEDCNIGQKCSTKLDEIVDLKSVLDSNGDMV